MNGYSVCRMHGARGGAPMGNKNALKHGRYSGEAITFRRMVSEIMNDARQVIEAV